MANSFIQTPTDGTGKKLDTWTTTTLAQHRQAVVIGAKDTDANVAPVDATAGLKVDLGADNDVIVTSGTITTITNPVKINDGTDTMLIDTNGSAQVIIKDGSGNTVTFNANGQATAANSAPVVLATEQDTVKVDDAAFTPGTSRITMVGFEADESATDSVDEGDAGAARMTLDRKQITNPQPHTAGGLTIFRSIDLDETEEEIKASAGQVYGLWVTNTATSTRFLKFYNATAANVTVGTTTPVITIGIPGNSSDDVSGLFSSTMGIAFDTAITAAATTGVADADTGAPGANEVIINVFYK